MTDHNKNLRKIMLTNSSVHNPSSSSSSSSSISSSSAAISAAPASAFVYQTTNISPPQQTTVSLASSVLYQTVVPFSSLASQSSQHGGGANSTGFDSSPASMSNSSTSSTSSSGDPLTTAVASSSASRKRRKQEIKKQGEETTVSYNTNPLSNNNALAYANAAMLAAARPAQMAGSESKTLSRPLVFHETSSMNGGTAISSSSKYLDEDDDAIYDSDEEVSTSASNAAKHPPSKIPRLCPSASASASSSRTEESLAPIKNEKSEPNDVEMVRSSDDEACLDDEEVQRLSKSFRYISSNGLSWSAKKCKPAAILNKVYKTNWKARSYHYLRYSDIKVKGIDRSLTTPLGTCSIN